MKGPIKDFFGTIVTGCGVLFIAQATIMQLDFVTKSRLYRDLTGETPFYDVAVYKTAIAPEGLVTLGELTKRRCQFFDLYGFAQFDDAPDRRVLIDTRPEDGRGTKGNRIPTGRAEAWGPWVLIYGASLPRPDMWTVRAGHLCPVLDKNGNELHNPVTGEVVMRYENNLFATGEWRDLQLE